MIGPVGLQGAHVKRERCSVTGLSVCKVHTGVWQSVNSALLPGNFVYTLT